jgi:plastocyanin
MNRATRWLSLLAAGALLPALLGCAPPISGLNAPTEPSVAPSPGGATVLIQGFAFVPPTVTIKAGETVTWTNKDGVPHDATFAPDFTTGYISQGGSFTRRFDTPGTYTYACKEHPAMAASSVVVQ